MQHERHRATPDERCFETLDALLEGPFAICAIVTDADGAPADWRFLRVSEGFAEATGLAAVAGRTAREVAPDLEASWLGHVARVALGRETDRFVETSGPGGRTFELRAAPLDPPGRFAIHFRDLTAIRRLEAERAEALARAERLLRELGHRVMNGFAAISAILAMEARAAPREGREPLARVQGRVQALGSLYRLLDGVAEADRLEVSAYLGGIVETFRGSLAQPAGVAVETALAPLAVPARTAVPLGLVLNELLTNAVKHAFGGRPGTIRVRLEAGEGTARLTVADDGRGLPDPGAAPAGSGGIGQGLVAAFVGELGGAIDTATGPGGTAVTVAFPA